MEKVMPTITAVLLAAFVAYALAWAAGYIQASFALLMFFATFLTGIYWLAEKLYFLPRRREAQQEVLAQIHDRREKLQAQGIEPDKNQDTEIQAQIARQPWWLDWTANLFPVLFVIFFVRSFLFEPFKIPSGSMIPTLAVGDLILVNKYTYGLRLPVLNTKITEGNSPERGDVMVFRYPPQPYLDYIKRVVAVPGDKVEYFNKRLSINGQTIETTALPDFLDTENMQYAQQFEEKLGTQPHKVLNTPQAAAFIQGASAFSHRENCTYTVEGVSCTVPEGHYFVLGDNRDNSLDSRYWGFVPEENIVGKAFFIWMNFGDFGRIGRFN